MKQLSQGCIVILRRLYNQKRIGGKHIPKTICLRWIKNLTKQEHREAIKDFDLCLKEGLILTKPKPSDIHVFLDPRRLEEIKEIIK